MLCIYALYRQSWMLSTMVLLLGMLNPAIFVVWTPTVRISYRRLILARSTYTLDHGQALWVSVTLKGATSNLR